jgi:hypothetical protein
LWAPCRAAIRRISSRRSFMSSSIVTVFERFYAIRPQVPIIVFASHKSSPID